jgi:hypothetical protein
MHTCHEANLGLISNGKSFYYFFFCSHSHYDIQFILFSSSLSFADVIPVVLQVLIANLPFGQLESEADLEFLMNVLLFRSHGLNIPLDTLYITLMSCTPILCQAVCSLCHPQIQNRILKF